MSRIASGCLGMKTILVAMSGSFCGLTRRLRQWNGRRHADLVAENARRVSLARRVLDESRVARAEHVLRAVAKADLERMITNWRRGAASRVTGRRATPETRSDSRRAPSSSR